MTRMIGNRFYIGGNCLKHNGNVVTAHDRKKGIVIRGNIPYGKSEFIYIKSNGDPQVCDNKRRGDVMEVYHGSHFFRLLAMGGFFTELLVVSANVHAYSKSTGEESSYGFSIH